jgi:molybdopterin-guanine dinucleotide biosynthesis protein A
VAVVLAGGTGTRVGLNIPNQLIKIAGKPIIQHTIAPLRMQTSPPPTTAPLSCATCSEVPIAVVPDTSGT